MKKLFFLLLFLSLFTVAARGAGSIFPSLAINVVSPNGGETLTAGTTQTIRWSYTGNPGSYVRIELLKGGVVSCTIANWVSARRGYYDWRLLPQQTPGNDYRIRITGVTYPYYTDTSDNSFTISARSNISVVSPNGGETLTAGTTQTIRWSYTGNPGSSGSYVKIVLLKGGVVSRTVANWVSARRGYYDWRLLPQQTPGSDYRIRITDVSRPSYTDASDNDFTIIAAGHVTDPLGDAFSSSYALVSPDIIGINTVTDSNNVTFQVRFDQRSFDATRDLITIFIDADRNSETGAHRSGMGIDCVVFMGSDAYGPNASFERLTGTPNNEYIGSAPVTFFPDGMNVTFPLSYFQIQGLNTGTLFDYRVTVSILIAENSFSGNSDIAPDGNLSPASSNKDSLHDTISPIPTTWTVEQVMDQIIAVNTSKDEFNLPEVKNILNRWNTPIEVNTNGIWRAEQALIRYEVLTGGLITFNRVAGIPANGVVFVEGVAVAEDGISPGCGNVSNVPGGAGVHFESNAFGELIGLYYINLGSVACDDAQVGNYESAIAEHEMGHVLGVLGHFEGYTGDEGLMDPNFFNVVYNIYNNPVGIPAANLNITLISVGEFGFYY